MRHRTVRLYLTAGFLVWPLVGCQPGAETAETAETASTGSVAGNSESLPPLAEMEVPVAAPSEAQRATWGVAIQPGSVQPGEVLTLAVKARMAPEWHVYAVNKPTDVQIPTRITLQLPAGIQELGAWEIPEPYALHPNTFAYEGEVTFRRRLKVADDAAPELKEIGCEIGYQACSDKMCLPPKTEQLHVALEVTPGPQ